MKEEIDGLHVIEEYLLTKGEHIVYGDRQITFKPLIDFALIVYNKKANTTNRLAMKFDLEKYFMRRDMSEMHGHDTKSIKVPQSIIDNVIAINNQYRNGTTIEE
jgi:hypothetical protein